MSENQDPASDKSRPVSSFANTDWLLQALINIVNSSDATISITLNVSGTMIHGELVGGRKYVEQVGAGFSRGIFGVESEESSRFAESFKEMGNHIYDQDKEEGQELLEPSFIHLRNAKFIHYENQTFPEDGGFWWRGKVTAVDGFFWAIDL